MVEIAPGVRIANDKNKYLIAMWKGLQEHRERPYVITKELYARAREEYKRDVNVEFDDFTIGWIGWMASFNGRFFDGGYSGHNVNGRDYISEQIRNVEKQLPYLQDVSFFSRDYKDFTFKEPCLIYCDIPYANTKQYTEVFNHAEFFVWARTTSAQGHTVFVSEYTAPEDFTCVWSKQVTNSLNQTKTYKPIERLFIAPKDRR